MHSADSPVVRQLERATWNFREKKASEHGRKAVQARRAYTAEREKWEAIVTAATDGDLTPLCDELQVTATELLERPGALAELQEDALAALRAAKSTERWHSGRQKGQRWRFRKLETCGSRVRLTRCDLCSNERKPVPEGCAIARLCPKCSLQNAKRRRARFGRARARTMLAGIRYGLTRANRKGGAWGERMVTLTVPHWFHGQVVDHVDELAKSDDPRDRRRARHGRELLEEGTDTVKLRVLCAWKAWPNFMRRLGRFLKQAGIEGVQHHRAAEWTPGNDALGHPHFHVWFWSPFLDERMLAAMWTEALLELGLPRPRTPDGLAVVHVKKIYGFNGNMAAELLKGGRREALTLSRLAFVERVGGGGEDVFSYAEGWTIIDVIDRALPDVLASLYEVLEGKRLSQASRGFFVDDEAPRCPCCWGEGHFRISFEPAPQFVPCEVLPPDAPSNQPMRGPP